MLSPPSRSPRFRKTVQLHNIQKQFRQSEALYRAFIGGRGSGKSWVACYDLLRRAKPNRTYLLASPSYPMLWDSEARMLQKLTRELGLLASIKISSPASLTLHNGAQILLRSADDPERLRGPNLSGAVLMEAALMRRDAYTITIACLREAGEQGWLSIATTPRGPQHWTFEEFATGKPHTALFRATTGDNPFNPTDFEKQLRDIYGDTNFARQELGGEFVQLEGAEFPGEWFAGERIWFDHWPESLLLKVIALDPSKGSDGRGDDYQAHVQIGVAVENQRYVLYVEADLDRLGVVQMCERTAELTRRFSAVAGGRPVDSVICEENGTMGLLQPALDAAAVRASVLIPYLLRANMENKQFRIRYYVAPPLSRYQIRFRRTPGTRMLVGQVQSFPFDEHDDGPDALSTGLRRVAEMLGGTAQ